MDDVVMRQTIKKSFDEPCAPEELIQAVVARARAVTLGREAQVQLKTAPPEACRELICLGIVGQLAMRGPIPKDVPPRQLAQQLQHTPEMTRALQGGNLLQRLDSGELMRQLVKEVAEPEAQKSQPAAPEKQGPAL